MSEDVSSSTSERSFEASERMLERARRTVPLGAQTFSKSYTQFPHGVSPYFADRAEGARVWDVDGNVYLDFINGLLAITLGHAHPRVLEAVTEQMRLGTIYSLSHRLEYEVAELIVEMAPCAEMVRFGKNGSDATAGAVRLARAFTGRDHVIVCGYHGWQDWYIGATARNLGVPEATRALTHSVPYNDLPALEAVLAAHEGAVAAVIMEPMNVAWPAEGYLAGVKERAHRAGALLIFDETITGFRFDNGGAQTLFGVTPDLATFGKGLANGFPLSAVAGRRDVMMLMEEIFFSFTMGGETASLAAAKSVLTLLREEPVLASIHANGERLLAGLRERVATAGAEGFATPCGHPSWSFLTLADTPQASAWELKTLFEQEMFARGVLSFGSHNLSYAHGGAEIDALLAAYDEVLPLLARAAQEQGALGELLRCAPLEPLFKVRG